MSHYEILTIISNCDILWVLRAYLFLFLSKFTIIRKGEKNEKNYCGIVLDFHSDCIRILRK